MEAARSEAVSEARESSAVVGVIDHFMLLWAHRNSAWLTNADYERFFRRVEKREPIGRAQRLLNLSALRPVARLVRVLRRHPAGVVDIFSRVRRLRPLVEIELGDELPIGITKCGLRAGERLIVHVGSEAYVGALAIFSMEAPSPSPRTLGSTILFVRRILSFGIDSEQSARSCTVRLRHDEAGGVELPFGEVGVECLVFGRADVLGDLDCN
jgi:hypothetical protein